MRSASMPEGEPSGRTWAPRTRATWAWGTRCGSLVAGPRPLSSTIAFGIAMTANARTAPIAMARFMGRSLSRGEPRAALLPSSRRRAAGVAVQPVDDDLRSRALVVQRVVVEGVVEGERHFARPVRRHAVRDAPAPPQLGVVGERVRHLARVGERAAVLRRARDHPAEG